MADDWQPGDLALCVRTTRLREILPGAVLTVAGIYRVGLGFVDTCQLGLLFVEVRSAAPAGGFDATRFRKIRPHTPDAEDAETIRLLTGAPVREPAA